jgi:hypothetical protein
MHVQRFIATARFLVDVQDLADDGRVAKEFTFIHPEELVMFMALVDEARAKARIQFAAATNELS